MAEVTPDSTLTLGERQRLFVRLVAQLIRWAYGSGYEISLGEAWRTPEQAQWNAEHGSGIKHSLHCDRLAIDLNLFRDGKYLTRRENYAPVGAYWKTLHPLCRWGGDFRDAAGALDPDSDHFSITYQGRQ